MAASIPTCERLGVSLTSGGWAGFGLLFVGQADPDVRIVAFGVDAAFFYR